MKWQPGVKVRVIREYDGSKGYVNRTGVIKQREAHGWFGSTVFVKVSFTGKPYRPPLWFPANKRYLTLPDWKARVNDVRI